MENKINVAELLKDCPKGMELDCLVYEGVTFDGIANGIDYPIKILTKNGFPTTLTKYGQNVNIEEAKCVIFPKGKTTWEGFVPPCKFKDGDILVHTQNQRFIMSIYHKRITELIIKTHCVLWDINEGLSINKEICCYLDSVRFATEEEKEKLFQAIKKNGYKWNEETKTLEKLPKFKVGDIIQNTETKKRRTITKIHHNCYECDYRYALAFENQDYWEIVPNKFDISTLVPFESRVLVRDSNREKWKSNFWGFYDIDHIMNYPYECCGASFAQCIPYEGNEHLLGTTDDCNEFYKTW